MASWVARPRPDAPRGLAPRRRFLLPVGRGPSLPFMSKPTKKGKGRTPLAAVVLAAGKGTRMKSSTAKVLHRVCGQAVVYFPVKRALEAGAAPVVVVVGHQADEVEAALRAALPGAPLRFARQEKQAAPPTRCWRPVGPLRGYRARSPSSPGTRRCSPPPRCGGGVGRARAARLRHHEPREPGGYGRVVHAPGTGARPGSSRRRTPRPRSGDQRGQRRPLRADADFLWTALARVDSQERPGRVLPDRPGGPGRRRRRRGGGRVDPLEASGVNDREELARAEPRAARGARLGADAGRRDPGGPGALPLRRGGGDRPRHDHRARRAAARRHPHRPGLPHRPGRVLVDAVLADGVTVKPYCDSTAARVGAGAVIGPFSRLRPGSDAGRGGCTSATSSRPRRPARARAPRPTTSPTSATPSSAPASTSARHHHLQLRRREEARDPHRRRRLHRLRLDPGGAHVASARAPTWPPARPSPRTCRPARWRWAAPSR